MKKPMPMPVPGRRDNEKCEVFNIRAPTRLWAIIEREADKGYRTTAAQIRMILEEWAAGRTVRSKGK